MTPPSGEVMDNRHSLAHNGELKSGTSDVSGYFGQVLRTTTAVLLRALGYTGKFFSLGVGEVQV
jgi:hypothetical protein